MGMVPIVRQVEEFIMSFLFTFWDVITFVCTAVTLAGICGFGIRPLRDKIVSWIRDEILWIPRKEIHDTLAEAVIATHIVSFNTPTKINGVAMKCEILPALPNIRELPAIRATMCILKSEINIENDPSILMTTNWQELGDVIQDTVQDELGLAMRITTSKDGIKDLRNFLYNFSDKFKIYEWLKQN